MNCCNKVVGLLKQGLACAAVYTNTQEYTGLFGIPTGPNGPQSVGPSGPHPHPHPNSVAAAQLEAAERLALATDPMVRLQMAGISPEYHAHTHAHTHAHSHTHLHLHPSQQAQAQQEAAAGFPLPGGYWPPPGGVPRGTVPNPQLHQGIPALVFYLQEKPPWAYILLNSLVEDLAMTN
uniref:Uncharacterized protein n=1 Tax=Timema cristinae TaxID=61476 RepID=A0A7R9CH64_TIMCR|nr:unnamed protein product [Timema cristinae]